MDELQALNELYSSPESPQESVIQRQREKLLTTIEATRTADPELPGRARRRRVIALVGVPVAAVALAAAGWAVLHEGAARDRGVRLHRRWCVVGTAQRRNASGGGLPGGVGVRQHARGA